MVTITDKPKDYEEALKLISNIAQKLFPTVSDCSSCPGYLWCPDKDTEKALHCGNRHDFEVSTDQMLEAMETAVTTVAEQVNIINEQRSEILRLQHSRLKGRD